MLVLLFVILMGAILRLLVLTELGSDALGVNSAEMVSLSRITSNKMSIFSWFANCVSCNPKSLLDMTAAGGSSCVTI